MKDVNTLKVLTLGNSLGVDSGHMLNLICAVEGIGQYDALRLATLYYSGCRLSKHVEFMTANTPAYRLYVSSSKTPDSPPAFKTDVTMYDSLRYDCWDIIVMMGNPWEVALDVNFTNGNVQKIQQYVNENKLNPNAIYAWHMPWALPADEALLKKYPYDPNPHYNNYLKYNMDKSAHYEAQVGCVERHILTDETFKFVLPTGTTIQNAWSSYLEEKDLHRDYAHASDLGRVMAAYTWYCVLMGIAELNAIKLDAIPQAFLRSTQDKTRDRVLTDMEKAVILESVNNALRSPMKMTQSRYTEAPQ